MPTKKIVFVTSGLNSNNFRSGFSNGYPYRNNQTYLLEDGTYYEDKNNQRFFLGTVKEFKSEISPGPGQSLQYGDLKGSLIIKYENQVGQEGDPNYKPAGRYLYWVDENGDLQSIFSGGGGSIDTSSFVKKITENWNIQNEGINSDFIISQGATEIFKIYKTTSGGSPDAKVEIKNAKTRIEDLDFGAW